MDTTDIELAAVREWEASAALREQYSDNKRAYVKYRVNSARGLIGVFGGRSPGAATQAIQPADASTARTGAGMKSFTLADIKAMRAAESAAASSTPATAVAATPAASIVGAGIKSFGRADIAAMRAAEPSPATAPKHEPAARSTALQPTPAAAPSPALPAHSAAGMQEPGLTAGVGIEVLAGMERNLTRLGVPLAAGAVIQAGSPEAVLADMMKRARFDHSQGRAPYMHAGECQAFRILELRKTGATKHADAADKACAINERKRRGAEIERNRQLAVIKSAGTNHALAVAHIRNGHEPVRAYSRKPQPAAA